MNWDTIQGKWKEMKGQVKQRWGKLTDDDFDVIDGKREELAGRIQQRYGVARDEADRQVNEFERSCRNV
ncbi:MAG: CsbD family protein [Pirellulales bacterium]|nr:CsbD family protein [Pirellulales bacterium]